MNILNIDKHNILHKAYLEQKYLKSFIDYYSKNTLPNLLIFYGPNKILKNYTLFNILIPIYLCIHNNGCGNCKSCTLLSKQEHPDLIVFPEDTIKIGDVKNPEVFTIRWLQKEIVIYKPAISPNKIIVIPCAEKLGLEAEIALLKTLEEPNEFIKFIFFTNSLDALKETIISRSVTIPLHSFSLQQMVKLISNPDLEYIEILGGSLDYYYIFDYELYKTLKQKVIQSLDHPLDLIELEQWCLKQSKDISNHNKMKENEFWEFFSLVFLQSLRRSKLYVSVSPLFFEFLIGIRADQPGLLPYLISKLFFQLYYNCYLITS